MLNAIQLSMSRSRTQKFLREATSTHGRTAQAALFAGFLGVVAPVSIVCWSLMRHSWQLA
jgi:hypothetical protein